MKQHISPYLCHYSRLSDVLAAIQVMGTYKWASRKGPDWAKMLGPMKSGKEWGAIFEQHPEFFRVNGEWVSLRWRHGYDRNFSTDLNREISVDEINELPESENEKLTRKPLTAQQTEALLKTAIEMHGRAIAHSQERRWMTPLLFALFGTVIGVVLQAALK
jgi:hypothetical protein